MIKFIFNGYYRAGTTLMYKILKESNPELLSFYEPLHPQLFDSKSKKAALLLHGFYPWDSYKHSDFKHIENEYKKYHVRLKNGADDIIPFNFKDITPLFDLLHNFKRDVILQPNRLHFVLNHIAVRYNCKYAHIIRNPINTWISQTITPLVPDRDKIKKKYLLIKKILGKWGKKYFLINYLPKNKKVGRFFFIDADYKLIVNKFNLNNNDRLDYLSKMLIVWTYSNYYAFRQLDKRYGMLVFYEDIVQNPQQQFNILSKFSGIKLGFTDIVVPKITTDEYLKYNFIKKLEKLGLIEMVNEFYPPENWFGKTE
jgi:hypothetical protein